MCMILKVGGDDKPFGLFNGGYLQFHGFMVNPVSGCSSQSLDIA